MVGHWLALDDNHQVEGAFPSLLNEVDVNGSSMGSVSVERRYEHTLVSWQSEVYCYHVSDI